MRYYKIEINVHLSTTRIRIRASELKEAKYHLHVEPKYNDDAEMTDIKMEIKLMMMMVMAI